MEVEDLKLWIEKYHHYEDRIEMLQREIAELEHEINRNSGSFPKVPDGTTDTRKIQLFFEIDGRMTRQARLKHRIKTVDEYENWCRQEDEIGGNIAMYRRMGMTWAYIEDKVSYSSGGAYKLHERLITQYLKQEKFS